MRWRSCAALSVVLIAILAGRSQAENRGHACPEATSPLAVDGAADPVARTGEASGHLPAGQPVAVGWDSVRPDLHLLVVGLSHHADARFDLPFPAADADGVADVMRAQEGRLFAHVAIKVLTDKDATAVAIRRGLKWLGDLAKPGDLTIVFLAGDGTTDGGGSFWFLPYDTDPDAVPATALSRHQIADPLSDLPGRTILLLDVCRAAGVRLNAAARCARSIGTAVSDFALGESGIVTFSACSGRELSIDAAEWGHGAFAKALIERFDTGRGEPHPGDRVTTASLEAFLAERVTELTHGGQHPLLFRPRGVGDISIVTTK